MDFKNVIFADFCRFLCLTSTDNYSVICLGTMLSDTIFWHILQNPFQQKNFQSTIFGNAPKMDFKNIIFADFCRFLRLTSTDNYSVICLGTRLSDTIFW